MAFTKPDTMFMQHVLATSGIHASRGIHSIPGDKKKGRLCDPFR